MLVTIPHSSNVVPEEIRPGLAIGEEEISNSWDIGSSELYGKLPARYVLEASFSRIAADLNRSPRALGPKGVVPLVDYAGRHLYRRGFVLTEEERKRRLLNYYWPFHKRIEEILSSESIKVLIDCHTLNGIGPKKAPDFGKRRPDVVLGNNGGSKGESIPELGESTCESWLMVEMASILKELGLSVKLNDPYPGGYITVHYGRILRRKGGIGIQIELNQDLFTRQGGTFLDTEALEQLRNTLEIFLKRLFEILPT